MYSKKRLVQINHNGEMIDGTRKEKKRIPKIPTDCEVGRNVRDNGNRTIGGRNGGGEVCRPSMGWRR